METGEILSTDAPNELLLNGLLDEDIALSIHVEGGKRSGYGMDLTITGTDGDLKVSNELRGRLCQSNPKVYETSSIRGLSA